MELVENLKVEDNWGIYDHEMIEYKTSLPTHIQIGARLLSAICLDLSYSAPLPPLMYLDWNRAALHLSSRQIRVRMHLPPPQLDWAPATPALFTID